MSELSGNLDAKTQQEQETRAIGEAIERIRTSKDPQANAQLNLLLVKLSAIENSLLPKPLSLPLETVEPTPEPPKLSLLEKTLKLLDELERPSEEKKLPLLAATNPGKASLDPLPVATPPLETTPPLPDSLPENVITPENSKEVLAKEMADSVKWLVFSGKVPDLADARRSIDFEDLSYVRKPEKDGTVSRFVTDTYTAPILRSIGRNDISHLHYQGVNNQVTSPPGEVTIRYTGSTYENGQRGIILYLSLVHGQHPLDHRWNNQTDYIAFDLDEVKGKKFLEEAIKDPLFIKTFLAELVRQRPNVIDSFTDPTYVVMATSPGLKAFDINRSQSTSGRRKIDRNSYVGQHLVSDGKKITRLRSKTVSDIDVDTLNGEFLETLEVHLPDSPSVRLDKEAADKKYTDFHSIPEEVKTQLESATNLMEITTIAETKGVSFLMKLANALTKVHYQMAENILERPDNYIAALEKLLEVVPADYGIREKVKGDFLTILNSLLALRSKTITPENILSNIKRLAQAAPHVVFDYSYTNTSSVLTQLETLMALKNQPVEFMKLLTGIENNDRLRGDFYTITSSKYDVDMKLFLAYSKKWNYYQKWQVKRLLKSGKGNTRMFVEGLKEFDPTYKIDLPSRR